MLINIEKPAEIVAIYLTIILSFYIFIYHVVATFFYTYAYIIIIKIAKKPAATSVARNNILFIFFPLLAFQALLIFHESPVLVFLA